MNVHETLQMDDSVQSVNMEVLRFSTLNTQVKPDKSVVIAVLVLWGFIQQVIPFLLSFRIVFSFCLWSVCFLSQVLS